MYVSENVVCYTTGRHVVLYNVQTQEKHIISVCAVLVPIPPSVECLCFEMHENKVLGFIRLWLRSPVFCPANDTRFFPFFCGLKAHD